MTQDEEWITGTSRSALLRRVFVDGGTPAASNGRPATGALLVAVAGAASFMASLSMQWQSVTVPRDLILGDAPSFSVGASATTPELLGLVYALGVVGLLGLAGSVLARAEVALRLRMTAAGLTVGLLGVVLAITVSLPGSVISRFGGLRPSSSAGLTVAYQPGLICAYVAVVLPIVAIWLAARPALRASAIPAARHAVRPPVAAGDRPGWGSADPEPIDLTVTPDG